MSCLIVTPEITELAKKLQDETEQSVLGLVALWQEQNNKSVEEYPTAKELSEFKSTIRNEAPKGDTPVVYNENKDIPLPVREQMQMRITFDSIERKDRVSLISQLFSREIDKALQETVQNLRGRMESATDEERVQLQADINSIDRYKVIKDYTPRGIFERVLNTFQSYINDIHDNRVRAEFDRINAKKGAERYSDDQKMEAAEKAASYKEVAYRKIVSNFNSLAREASLALRSSEGIAFNLQGLAPKEVNTSHDDPNGNSQSEQITDDSTREESVKDGWMTNYVFVSAYESLAQSVRKVIGSQLRLDHNGKVERDDLGFPRYLDPNYVHATLIDGLRYMIDSSDMIPLMEKMVNTKPWIKQIIKLLSNDNVLFSQFYQDFRKDFVQYWVQKRTTNPDGTFNVSTVRINKPESISYLLDQWRDNYESGNILDKDSIYQKDGSISTENAKEGLGMVTELINKMSNLPTSERLELINTEGVWNNIVKLLKMIGVDPNPSILRDALFNIKSSDTVKYTDPIMLLLPQLNIIFSKISSGGVKVGNRASGNDKAKDLINSFSSVYSSIATMLSEIARDAVESSSRENGKSYFSYIPPSYTGKLFKQLKNVRGDDKRFMEFIEAEFGKYDWFKKDGKWLNEWVKLLSSSQEARDVLDHKVLLNHDKVEYSDWDSIDYFVVLLNEFWSDPNKKTAYYYMPILSDSPSGEFIRFYRYRDGSEVDDNGDYMTYDDIIINKLVNLVMQEYNRIMLVRKRASEYSTKNPAISPIANYDTSYDTDGNVARLGGAEFKFLPKLNSYTFEDGEKFIDRITRLTNTRGSGDDLLKDIKTALRDIVEDDFEDDYKKWHTLGLFDELPNNKYKYFPSTFTPWSARSGKMVKALLEVKEVLGSLWSADMENLLRLHNNMLPVNTRESDAIINNISDLLTQSVTSSVITAQQRESIISTLRAKDGTKEALREYYWNSKYATSQIIQLLTTDLAFYKDLIEFQKRFKEVHSPSLRLNTNAEYKGEHVGKKVERTVYLKDDVVQASIIKDIEDIFNSRVKSGLMSRSDANEIIGEFKKVNVADAQAYRSLDSYRSLMVMSGEWNDDMESAYNNFKNNKFSVDDFNIIWQPRKPFVYTQVSNISGIDGTSDIKTPVQHKNSEFPLLAAYELISGPLGKSEKLRAISDFMKEADIDVVQFESAVKVGKQGIINLNNVHSYEDVLSALRSSTRPDGIENPNVVHSISYEDFGIQVQTPEHIIDVQNTFKTQIMKLITADILADYIHVGNRNMPKDELISLYQSLITENIIRSYADINEVFSDPKSLEKVLLEQITGSTRYSADMELSCTMDEDGNPIVPFFEPAFSQKTQELLTSTIKDRVTKQRIKGGSLIQVSAYGTDDLHIVFEGEGSNKHIKYVECYMPAYSEDFYRPLMKDGTFELDISKLDDNLRKLIGFRIPTEGAYSMVPLHIKGFLPPQSGASIILPNEWITISGSDFDVDKLYVMLPEFRSERSYDIKGAWDSFYNNHPELVQSIEHSKRVNFERALSELLDRRPDISEDDLDLDGLFSDFVSKHKNYEWVDGVQKQFTRWFNDNKAQFYTGQSISRVQYDYNKTPKDNTLAQRNNAIIDIMYGILTSPDAAHRILNPGSARHHKKAARIMDILSSSTRKELASILSTTQDNILDKLLSMDIDELSGIADSVKVTLDPLSPSTQLYFHRQNMTGANLIGVYANHVSNHALMQHTDLALNAEEGAFVLNGKDKRSLHDLVSSEGEYTSRNVSGYLNSSVDNVKDPILASLNQNNVTAHPSAMLARLGYNPVEIGLLMRQPIIMDVVKAYFRNDKYNRNVKGILNTVIREYRKKAQVMHQMDYNHYKNNQFMAKTLADDIMIYNEMGGITRSSQTTDYDIVRFYERQLAVGYLFSRILKDSDALKGIIQATKADTTNGGAGPTIADIQISVRAVEDVHEQYATPEYPLDNANVIKNNITFDSIDNLRDNLLGTQLPYMQAFYTLGIEQAGKMLSNYFPQMSPSFEYIISTLNDMTRARKLDARTMNNIYNELIAFIMTKIPFFGTSTEGDNIISSYDKRYYFIHHFPSEFQKIVAGNEDIADLEFISSLKVVKAGSKYPVDSLVLSNVGKLNPALREKYMADWEYLLYMNNPVANKLALDLALYNFYRNGLVFGPNSFGHLMPLFVKLSIPEYISTLRETLNTPDDLSYFIDQYIYNHLDNRKFVPVVGMGSSIKFLDNNGKPLDEVVLSVGEDSADEDRNVVKRTVRANDGTVNVYFDYIGYKHGRDVVYYRLTDTDGNTATYYRIPNVLGIKGMGIEYDYNKDATEMTSVFEDVRNTSVDLSDVTAFEDVNVAEDDGYDETYTDSFTEASLREAYSALMNEELVNRGSENDILSIDPNTEFRDGNDQIICGSEIIKTY